MVQYYIRQRINGGASQLLCMHCLNWTLKQRLVNCGIGSRRMRGIKAGLRLDSFAELISRMLYRCVISPAICTPITNTHQRARVRLRKFHPIQTSSRSKQNKIPAIPEGKNHLKLYETSRSSFFAQDRSIGAAHLPS